MYTISFFFVFFVCLALVPLSASQTVNGINWTNCPNASRPIPLSRTTSVSVSSTLISQVNTLFPEGSSPNTLLVNPNTDAFIVLQSTSNISFTFVAEGAGYRNQFGYFLFDDNSRNVKPDPGYVMVFPDVSATSSMGSNGCMYAGVTTTLGPFPAGTVLGFWVRADGFNQPTTNDFWVSYTTDVLTNSDGYRHIAWARIEGQVVIGFEDLRNLGDKDYNDVMFYLTTDGNYTANDLVEYVNGTLQGCSNGEIVKFIESKCTQFAVLEARNTQACQGFIKIPDSWILAPNDTTTRDAVLNNPSAFTKSDGTSLCLVLADGTAVDNTWTSCATTSPPQVFSKDSTCFNVGCSKRILIKGTTALPACTGSESLLCNPSVSAAVISRTPSNDVAGLSFLPLSWSVYISDLLAGSTTVNFTLNSVAQSSQRLDVVVLIDSNNMASADFDTAKNQIPVLYNLLNSRFATPPNVGFAIHSRPTSSTYRLDVLSRLTTDGTQLSSIVSQATPSQYIYSSQSRSQIIQCVQTLAADTSMGWRGGNVFAAIVVVSITQQESNSTLASSLQSTLYSSGITPIYIVPPRQSNSPYNNYNSFTGTGSSNLNMGWAYQASSYQWASMANSGLDTFSNSIRFYRTPGTGSAFWNNIPSATTISNACVNSKCAFNSIGVRYPSNTGVTYTFPLVASLTIPGYGVAVVNIIGNAAPTVVNASLGLDEDTGRTFSLQAFANDVDKNALRIIFLTLPSSAITAGGTQVTLGNSYDVATVFTITPDANANGQQFATFRVTDGCKNSTIGTITFTINPINDPPTAMDTSRTINEDTNADFSLSALINDIDDTTASLIPVIVTLPANGRMFQLISGLYQQVTALKTAVTQDIRFTPNLNWFGSTSFTYYVRDPSSAVSTTRTISVSVNPVNDAPSCLSVTLAGFEDTTLALSGLAGSDVDGDSITYTILSITTSSGTLRRTDNSNAIALPFSTTSGGVVTFFPNSNVNGNVATISYIVTDSSGANSSTCTAAISLTAVNDPPIALDISVSTPEDTPFIISFGSSISDVETAASSLVVTIRTRPDPSLGVLRDASDSPTDLTVGAVLTGQSVYFIPRTNYNGQVTFTYSVSDGSLNSQERTVTINVTPVNDIPTISTSATTVVGIRGTASTFTVTIRDVDITDPVGLIIGDNDIVASSSTTGALALQGNSALTPGNPITVATYANADGASRSYVMTWIPGTNAPDNLSWNITFYAKDSGQPAPSATSSSVTVTLVVQANRAPTVLSNLTGTTSEDTTLSGFVLRGTDFDSTSQATSLQAFLVKLPDNGEVRQGGSRMTTGLTNLVVDSGNTVFNIDYVPNLNFNGQDTFSFYFQDSLGAKSGTSLVTITVTPVNDPPTGSSFAVTLNEDTTVTITSFSGTDVDGDTLTLTILSLPSKGALIYQSPNNNSVVVGTSIAAGSWNIRFTPAANENGSPYTTLTFCLNDANSNSQTYTVTFNVLPVNDVPTASNFLVTTDEDTGITFDFSNFISDVETPDNQLSIIIQSLPSSTICTIRQVFSSNSDIAAYTTLSQLSAYLLPVANAYGSTSFTYAVFDGVATSNTATVTIIVNPVNDAPTLSSQVFSATAGRNIPVTIPINMQDVDKGDAITLRVISYTAGSQGVLAVLGGSTITSSPVDIVTRPNTNGGNEIVNLIWTPSGGASDGQAGQVVLVVNDSGTPPPSVSSNQLIIALNVANNNSPTSPMPGNFSINEDTTYTGYIITGSDTDYGEGTTLIAFISTLPSNGKLFQGSSEVTGQLSNPSTSASSTSFSINYVPNQDYNGQDSFSYYFQDTPGGTSAIRTVYITVVPVNDAPTSQGFDITTNEDTQYTFTQFVASDIDSSIFTLTITQLPLKGTLLQAASNVAVTQGSNIASSGWGLRYTPTADDSAPFDTVYTTFKFRVNDNGAPSLSSPEYTVNIYVLPVNDAPTASDFSVTTSEESPITISFASRVNDVDNNVTGLVITIKSRPSATAGVLRVDSGSTTDIDSVTVLPSQSVYFVPCLNYNGQTTFTYSVGDGSLSSVDRTVTIIVSPVNDVPTAAVSTTLVITTRTVGANFTVTVLDVDIGDVVSTIIGTNNLPTASSTTGTLAVAGNPSLTPAASITVASYSNPDGAASTVTLTWTPSALAPDDLAIGLAFFAKDVGQPSPSESSAAQTVILRVALNNPPTTIPPGSQILDEDTNKMISLAGTDLDTVTSEQKTLTIVVTTLPLDGTLFHNGTAITAENTILSVKVSDTTGTTSVVIYYPKSNFNGQDSFGYYVYDSLNAKSAPTVVPIIVNPINDPPTTRSISATGYEDQFFDVVGFSAEDIDGDYITYQILTAPGKGKLFFNGGQIASYPFSIGAKDISLVSFQGALNENGSPYTTFTFCISDGNGGFSSNATGTLNVLPINDAPVATDNGFNLDEDTTISINFNDYVSDVDNTNAQLSVVIASLPSNGKIIYNTNTVATIGTVLSSNKAITYQPADNYNGPDSFDWYVLDTSNARGNAVFSFNVAPRNDPPSSSNIVVSTFRGTPVDINDFIVNDVDTPFASITLTLIRGEGIGTLTDVSESVVVFPMDYDTSSTWTFTWTPPGIIQFYPVTTAVAQYIFKLNDGVADSSEYTITVNLIYSNYAPFGESSLTTTPEDTPVLIALDARDYESSFENLKTIIVSLANSNEGQFYVDASFSQLVVPGTVLPNKTMWFVPNLNAYSVGRPLASFTYVVKDESNELSPVYDGVVYVTPVDDAPTYGGKLEFDVLEDTNLDMTFIGQIVDVDSNLNATMTITSGVSRGQLYECTGATVQCDRVPLTNNSVVINVDKRVSFVPALNENSQAYASFTFTLTDAEGTVSVPYQIVINVIPVNDPPVIHPYFTALPGRVEFDEDTEYIFSWNVTDIDSPLSEVSVTITSVLPSNAQLFLCDTNNGVDCARGAEIVPPAVVPFIAEGVYKVLYVPAANAFDIRNFGSFNLVAEDDFDLPSYPVKSIIRVLPINDAPFISTQYISRTAYPDQSGIPMVTLNDVDLVDIDSGKNKMEMNITCSVGNITINHEDAFVSRIVHGRTVDAPCSFIMDTNGNPGVMCHAPQEDLNNIYLHLTKILFEGVETAAYQVFITVNDLGHIDKNNRPLTSQLILTVTPQSNFLEQHDTVTDNTLTIALTISAAVAIGGVIGVIFGIRRKYRGAGIDSYFNNLTEGMNNTAATSAIYAGRFQEGVNPFYEQNKS